MNEEQKVPPYGQVNTLNGDKSVWLVKVPPVIFDEWMKAPPRATLGRIEVETIPGSSDVKVCCLHKRKPKETFSTHFLSSHYHVNHRRNCMPHGIVYMHR